MCKRSKLILGFCLIVLLLQFSSAMAQPAKVEKSGSGGGYFMMGVSVLDVDDLNTRLANSGYPEFSNNFISIGGGGRGFVNKFVLGGQGHTLIAGDENITLNNTAYKTSLTAGYGLFNFGYLIYSKNRLNIYPLIGLGGGGLMLKITEDSSPSFDEILANPKRSVELNFGVFLLSVSLGMEYFIKLGEDEKGIGGLIVGLEAGYMIAPFSDDWMMEKNDVIGGPDIGFQGPYIRFMFGGGGMSKQR